MRRIEQGAVRESRAVPAWVLNPVFAVPTVIAGHTVMYFMETHIDKGTGLNIKDSGTRRDFGTGSVRDAATGKGRMDLLPVFALHRVCEVREDGPYSKVDQICAGVTAQHRFLHLSLSTALWYVRGLRDQPYLEAAAYFAMVALEMRDRGVYFTGELPPHVLTDPLPWGAVIAVSKLYEAGCLKYGDRNWEKGQPLHIYMDSGMRHLVKHLRGDTDEDHLVAACWNFLCCLETSERISRGTLPESLADGMPALPKVIKGECSLCKGTTVTDGAQGWNGEGPCPRCS